VAQDYVVAATPAASARFVRVTITPRAVCPDWHPGAGRLAWAFWGQLAVAR
jgi:hypothetical protein